MKKFTFISALLLLSLIGIAQTPGSSICPDFFRRNNGNGNCPDGELKLYYLNCPAVPPIIDSVYTNGVKANVAFSFKDASKCSGQKYISYCVSGGNMPPAAVWQIYFHNPGSIDPFGCLVPEAGPLPVTVSQFDLTAKFGNQVLLNWVTENEDNHNYFEVQRAFDQGDFKSIAMIMGPRSVSGTKNNYDFTDISSELNGRSIAYYRLKQIDKSGQIHYSSSKVVRLVTRETGIVQVSPNPFVDMVTVKVLSTTTGNAQIRVTDLAGKSVSATQKQVIKGSNEISLNTLSKLSTGIYLVQIWVNDVLVDTQKMIKN